MSESTQAFHLIARLVVSCGWMLATISALPAAEIQGFTAPYQDIDLAAPETGIVEAIDVKLGDRVAQGQTLVRLDAAVFEMTLEIAKSIKESRGRFESVTEELQLHTRMVEKLNELYARQHASRQELQRARAEMRMAEAQLKAVREELDTKTLEYQRAQLQLERRHLKSPIDGIVTQIFKDRGESVSLSEPVIVKIVQLDPLLVIFLVPADLARPLRSEQKVRVKFAEMAKSVQGHVEFVSPTTDSQSGLTRVHVRLPNPNERLPCGVTCYLLLDDSKSSRLISTDQ